MTPSARTHAFPTALVERAAAIVRDRAGLVFPPPRRATLADGLAQAHARSAHGDPVRYLERLETDADLLDDLIADIVVGETYFLRHPEQLDVIGRTILPSVAAAAPDRRLRLWSAGCATGEEAYSLAMLCIDAGLGNRTEVVATDVSRRALAVARRARYGPWSLRAVPDDVKARHFHDEGRTWRVDDAVRQLVDFGYLNLGQSVYPSLEHRIWGMDVIVCRNVLIYFDRAGVAEVARRLVASLAPGGWLVMGVADPMINDLVECETVVTPAGIVYRPARAPQPARARTAVSGAVRTVPPAPRARRSAPAPKPAAAAPQGLPHLEALYAARRYDDAVALAHTLVERTPGAPDAAAHTRACVLLVRAHANSGALEAAARHCMAALERHPDAAELLYLHSVLLVEAGHPRDAADAARRALYCDPAFVVAHLALGAALAAAGDPRGARRAYRNAGNLLA
ncbi:MAG: protein-glutamate O-methyltransferase CheR, partial [Gemmatimonadota bacterium]|nr:protein-glutamate O-methyltransferase CheR [Gemmatimonadota bacterium]